MYTQRLVTAAPKEKKKEEKKKRKKEERMKEARPIHRNQIGPKQPRC